MHSFIFQMITIFFLPLGCRQGQRIQGGSEGIEEAGTNLQQNFQRLFLIKKNHNGEKKLL